MRKLSLLLCLSLSIFTTAQTYVTPKLPSTMPSITIKHYGYTVSFNVEHNNPNFVGWSLYKERLEGNNSRINKFTVDKYLPKTHRVTTDDYKYSGYDRGHMCPAADNKWDYQAMYESFYMSNICPQNQILNRQWWEHLESACRRWAKNDTIYIVCGPIYNQKPFTIGQNIDVSVPDAFFKVILNPSKSQAIGFYYDNDDTRQTMENAACSVDLIEEITKYDFFHELPDSIERKVESTFDLKKWK